MAGIGNNRMPPATGGNGHRPGAGRSGGGLGPAPVLSGGVGAVKPGGYHASLPTAFALIELLVVITTIALLAGLLFLRSHMLDWLLNGGPADLTLPES